MIKNERLIKLIAIVIFVLLVYLLEFVLSYEKARISIITNPEKAKIFINGERRFDIFSETSKRRPFFKRLKKGEYLVEAIIPLKDGMSEYYGKKTFLVETRISQTVTLKLDKRPSADYKMILESTYPNGIPEPEMVSIPGGSFMMGCVSEKGCSDSNESPVHLVTLPSFKMGVTEITFEQYDACVVFGGCAHYPDDEGWGRGNRPVMNVSWENAQQYVKWLTQRTGNQYRLPTEAEWEYAARAGSTKQYSWCNDIGKNKANCNGCGSLWDSNQTAPVGIFTPNNYGLYDMEGNVAELCQDWYSDTYYQKSTSFNPKGPVSGSAGRRISICMYLIVYVWLDVVLPIRQPVILPKDSGFAIHNLYTVPICLC